MNGKGKVKAKNKSTRTKVRVNHIILGLGFRIVHQPDVQIPVCWLSHGFRLQSIMQILLRMRTVLC